MITVRRRPDGVIVVVRDDRRVAVVRDAGDPGRVIRLPAGTTPDVALRRP